MGRMSTGYVLDVPYAIHHFPLSPLATFATLRQYVITVTQYRIPLTVPRCENEDQHIESVKIVRECAISHAYRRARILKYF